MIRVNMTSTANKLKVDLKYYEALQYSIISVIIHKYMYMNLGVSEFNWADYLHILFFHREIR